MANMVGQEKIPEWTIEEISGNRIALKQKGIVVKTFYSHEDMKEWWAKRFPDQGSAPNPETVLDLAIRKSGW